MLRDALRELVLAGATSQDFEEALEWAREQLRKTNPVDEAAAAGKKRRGRGSTRK